MEWFNWLMANYMDMMAILGAVVGVAEMVVRMTPTEKDDGFVQRLGGWIKGAMDFLKIPNISSK